MSQLRFPFTTTIKPPRPTITDDRVALRIAEAIVREVNPDDFYWEEWEVPDRIHDVQQEITRCGRTATVFTRLAKTQPPNNFTGTMSCWPYQ